MKLRSVLLVLLVLCGFFLLTTHFFPIGTIAGLVHGSPQQSPGIATSTVNGPMGTFRVTAAEAAPSLDSEEEQNISVYKRAPPSVVNITSVQVAYDFFYQPVPQPGQ